ncbi:MAG: ATP-binding protein, partial [Planctomycetota bacterium]|nr:ATP-binding protein [Planctomycetota bacterium]
YEGIRGLERLVEDDGPGIDPGIQNKLFTPFFSTKSQGTGLGLALAQKIIDAHGGDISYESMETVGSRFRIRLPLTKTQEEEPSNPSQNRP